jgi:hypothetical protein
MRLAYLFGRWCELRGLLIAEAAFQGRVDVATDLQFGYV